MFSSAYICLNTLKMLKLIYKMYCKCSFNITIFNNKMLCVFLTFINVMDIVNSIN